MRFLGFGAPSQRADGAIQEDPMRPLIQLPGWDGKLVLAALFFVGYYALVWRISAHDIPPANVQLIRDQLLVLGPGVGVILGAIYRQTAAEERKDQAQANILKTAIETPSTVVAQPDGLADGVEKGARTGAREGVSEGLNEQANEDPLPDYAR